MSIINFIELKEKFEIQAYRNIKNLDRNTHIPFSGSPRKHPYDKSRVILVADPFTENTFFYEFKVKDITCAEELTNITNLEGKSVPMVRIWVKKQSIAIQCTPFIVESIKHNS
ncbi:MAG: inorganic pyrophosphatase Ppa [Proteobacteria bacterium]|nr:inorganic pyrophosphatase Ppa [Pseudomonadota bacterium]MBU1584734.1 inorganic pyrophosphatase Ppa [Pseudomonadota bacterium]MBU2454432.1 inorganic pyrophosphatase Ppa [Pseudomonadota bacterium]MBU2628811.1 inorganic pyrophosphatase Ppa [Pseudomonadota bacterium]